MAVHKFFLPPQSTYPLDDIKEIPLVDVAQSVVHCYPTVFLDYEDGATPQHVLIEDLLLFDPFHAIKEMILREIFSRSQSDTIVPVEIMASIRTACNRLGEILEHEPSQSVTYTQVYRELVKYSVFTDGNLFVSSKSSMLDKYICTCITFYRY